MYSGIVFHDCKQLHLPLQVVASAIASTYIGIKKSPAVLGRGFRIIYNKVWRPYYMSENRSVSS